MVPTELKATQKSQRIPSLVRITLGRETDDLPVCTTSTTKAEALPPLKFGWAILTQNSDTETSCKGKFGVLKVFFFGHYMLLRFFFLSQTNNSVTGQWSPAVLYMIHPELRSSISEPALPAWRWPTPTPADTRIVRRWIYSANLLVQFPSHRPSLPIYPPIVWQG